jgi:hypothetical protein
MAGVIIGSLKLIGQLTSKISELKPTFENANYTYII